MLKRILPGFLAGILLLSSASAATIEFTVGDMAFNLEKDGTIEQKTVEAPPFINDAGRTMVPARAISEAFGAEVGWEEATRTVTIKKNETEIKLVVEKDEATVNGETKKLDCAPTIVADRTMVPLRFIGESLGCNVGYAALTNQILIDDTEPVVSCGDAIVSFAEFKALYDIFYLGNLEAITTYGLDEISYGQLVAQITLEAANATLHIMSAYPSVVLTQDEKAEVMRSYGESLPILPGLKGLAAILFEKNYIAAGEPVIRTVLETEDIKARYAEKYVMAKHILVSDEKTAEEVYAKAVAGEDFDALIAQYGTDPGALENPDGYLFTTGEMVESFEKATFAAAVGEITKPVESEYGYHIIKKLPLPAYTDEVGREVAIGIINQHMETVPAPKTVMGLETLYEKLGVATQ